MFGPEHFLHDDVSSGEVVVVPYLEHAKFVVGDIFDGGMGHVLQLIPIDPHVPPVALKTAHENLSIEQFEREAQVWMTLTWHPFVAHAVAYGEFMSHASIAAWWYSRTLRDFKSNELSLEQIEGFVMRLIDGLSYAFENHGVIHKDIKPANIFVDMESNPRIADFGLSAFSRRRLPHLRNIGDVRVGMRDSVSLGVIGGTPVYMAPELFGSNPASVSTDIYALGVTLFEWLTGEHPYISERTEWHFSAEIRHEPLKQALNRFGRAGLQLQDLILLCVSLDPASRPESYDNLLSLSGYRHVSKLTVGQEDEIAVSRAQVLREQDRCNEACEVLLARLKASPDDPLLLNAYGALMFCTGNREQAIAAWEKAFSNLSRCEGIRRGKPYADPAINLGKQLIYRSQFDRASQVLSAAWGWLSGESEILRYEFPEFGWLLLYKGQFAYAYDHIVGLSTHREPDCNMVAWATLSAYLDGTIKDHARDLRRMVLSVREVTVIESGCGRLLAAYLTDDEARPLLDRLTALMSKSPDVTGRQGVLSVLGSAPSPDMVKVEASLLEHMYTGGKFRGVIGAFR